MKPAVAARRGAVAVEQACPPHHWVIGQRQPDNLLPATCKRCGRTRTYGERKKPLPPLPAPKAADRTRTPGKAPLARAEGKVGAQVLAAMGGLEWTSSGLAEALGRSEAGVYKYLQDLIEEGRVARRLPGGRTYLYYKL